MKLLLLGHTLSTGGAERQIVNLAKALAERDVEIHLATFYQGGRFEQEVHSANRIQFHPLRKSGSRDIVWFGWHLRRLIARHRFDVIYSFLQAQTSPHSSHGRFANGPKSSGASGFLPSTTPITRP